MNTINTTKALELIKESKGKAFTVVYRKKDNTMRVLNGRLGVKKGLTGKGMSYNPDSKGLLPVYDLKASGYRMVTVANIESLKINKVEYHVTDKQQVTQNKTLWETFLSFFQ